MAYNTACVLLIQTASWTNKSEQDAWILRINYIFDTMLIAFNTTTHHMGHVGRFKDLTILVTI